MKALLRQCVPGRVLVFPHKLISMLLAFVLAVWPGLSSMALAQSAEIGVLATERGTLETGAPKTEASLLLLLKQVGANFSTIQLKELSSFKGKLLIAPLSDEAPPAFYEALTAHKGSPTKIIFLPMVTKPNKDVEALLAEYSFTFEASQYLNRSLPLKSTHNHFVNTYIPIGSYVYKVSSGKPPLAYWGNTIPAAVATDKAMLINWNWLSTLPPFAFEAFMERWQGAEGLALLQRPTIAHADQQQPRSFLGQEPTDLTLATVPGTPSTTEAPTVIAPSFEGNTPQVVTSLTTSAAPAAETAQSISVQTNPNETPENSPKPAPGNGFRHFEISAQTTPELAAMPPSVTVTVPAMPPNQGAAAEEKDSNPDELYDFDGGSPRLRGAAAENAIAEYYNDRMREFSDLLDKVNLLAGQSMNYPEKYAALRGAMDTANLEKSKFETYWFQQNWGPALEAIENAKNVLMTAIFDQIPTSQVEGRAIWLDRGSIVRAGNPEALRQLIRQIAGAGFNVIYFETINAGFPIYPSHIIEQNPQVRGWDPLAVAVDEAHKSGVELHAWVWCFAVGNTRHNKILGLPASYPGPILSKPELASEALRGRNGELVLPEQHEYWLSPASLKARSFLISMYSEIVRRYPVDGLQLDYIRYPFQKPNFPMGFEPFSQARFSGETGLSITEPNEYTAKAWAAWKAFQVTSFVRDVNRTLKGINPNLKLSAAVFPLARHSRMTMIQQDWETWVRNGWIDTLNPMAYSRSPRSLERLVQYIHNVGDDKTLVYPGLSLSKLDAISLLDALEICRRTGVMGTTLFAVTQFDNSRRSLLQTGPYKQRKTVPPHRDPLGASQQMVSEAQALVENLLKKNQGIGGLEALMQINGSLKALASAQQALAKTTNVFEANRLVGQIQDDARVLKQRAEQCPQCAEDSVAGFQAQVVKQVVDKVVRMVNYATFQYELSERSRRQGALATSTNAVQ